MVAPFWFSISTPFYHKSDGGVNGTPRGSPSAYCVKFSVRVVHTSAQLSPPFTTALLSWGCTGLRACPLVTPELPRELDDGYENRRLALEAKDLHVALH